MVIVGAEDAGSMLTLGYLRGGVGQLSHNIIGIAGEEGPATTRYFHLIGRPGKRVMFSSISMTTEELVEEGYVFTRIPIAAEGARKGLTTARELAETFSRAGYRSRTNPMWSHLGPNCTTVANQILKSAGDAAPAYAQTPFLLHLGFNYGSAPATALGGAVPALAAGGARQQPVK